MRTPFNIGAMRHPVQLVEEVDTRQRGGGLTSADTPRDEIMAAISTTNRRVTTSEGGEEVRADYEVMIRPPLDDDGLPRKVTLDWVIKPLEGVYAGKRLEVRDSYDPNGLGQFVALVCLETAHG